MALALRCAESVAYLYFNYRFFHLRILERCCSRLMLSYLEQAVTKNAGEKKIHSLLDWIGHAQEPGLLQAFYTVTLDALALVRIESCGTGATQPTPLRVYLYALLWATNFCRY